MTNRNEKLESQLIFLNVEGHRAMPWWHSALRCGFFFVMGFLSHYVISG